MSVPTLTRRQLNRALLARQALLERAAWTPVEAVVRLVGMQAQLPNPPYIGLWTRLQTFARADLTQAMEARDIVRAAFMRSTLHLTTRADHQQFRTAIQPALEKGLRSFFGERAKGMDNDRIIGAARGMLAEESLSMGSLKARLLEVSPERDGDALNYLVRTIVPLVQVPPGGTWGSGSAGKYTLAEEWFGAPPDPADNIGALLKRYLAAFGPASVMDAQFWLGRTKLKDAFDALKPELRLFRDEQERELYDLPDAPLPDADTPAPVRYIPEYDNLLMGHDSRARVLADADYRRVFLTAARILNTFLVDGFVAGTWKIEKTKTSATLIVSPFAPLSADTQSALAAEGERLARFMNERIETVDVQFRADDGL
ncbi:MAG: winged helix DNA-binding domain-containing protein [Chloroflexota bacterium]|nr:winged helix DNA-binding domain-containing protein [Chloroflexota bacterium]